jgi:diguanylate cyclase (GGDEF)-like protein/hemerythrin-like metal-binding protein
MKQHFRRMIDLGCTPALSRSHNRMVRMTNLAALVGAILYLIFAFFYASLDLKTLFPAIVPVSLVIPLLLFTIYLNYKQRYTIANRLMNLAVSIPVFINLWFFFGNGIGCHYFFILFAMLPVITIFNKKRWIIFLSSMNLAFFVLIFNHTPIYNLAYILTPETQNLINVIAIHSTCTAVVLVFYIYQQILDRSETDLENHARRLKSALDEVNELAIVDGLTGIYNRRFLEDKIKHEIFRAERYQLPLSLIMFDLDYFKTVNDRFGHDTGDKILRDSVNTLLQKIRGTDTFGRWGGEEFIILLPQTDLDGALLLAEKLRRTLEDESFTKVGKITASFGAAEWKDGETFDDFYRRLDLSLYHAKEAGRNQVSTILVNQITTGRMHFVWNSEWASGDANIDQQHHRLLDIANQFVDLAMSDFSLPEVMALLDKLVEDVNVHFAEEEKTLEQIHFSDLEKHKESHQKILKRVGDIRWDYAEGRIKSISFFVFVFEEIILGHLQTGDAQYFSSLKTKLI